MNRTLTVLRWRYGFLAMLFFAFLSTQVFGQISLSCPNDVAVTASTGSNTAVATWNTATATTGCTVPVTPDCSSINTNISGFMYIGEYNGSKYFCSNGNNYTWWDARDLSIQAGGHLVTINDAGENEFIQNHIGASEAWIGYNDAASEGDFTWVNGESSSYENWTCWSSNDCEPNQTGDYVRLVKATGEWGDQAGTCKEEFVMEIPCSACQAPAISGFMYMGMYNNSKYYCSDGSDYTFAQAKNLSEAAGGYLVTINDAGENEFVRNVIGADKAWIGYTDEGSEGDYYWVNGENSSYSNWKSWAPDGGTGQNYTVLYKSDGEWNDKGSNYHAEFVMEVPCGPNTQPGDVTVTQTGGQPSGSAFSVGSHTITYTATDDCGDTETCSFTVTVNPGQPATPASVGNYVWSDTNANGIQDAGEPGIAGVFVMITDCDGNWVNNMVTDANGAYSFTNLAPGQYQIKFVAPQDYTVTTKDAGSNDNVDSDVNPGWTGLTDCFTLASGENNTSIDAGFVPNAPTGTLNLTCNNDITVTATNTQNTAQVSWNDPTATSTCSTGSVSVTQSAGPTSGSMFPVGTTTISYNATDGCGNFETCSFTVTVEPSGGNDPASVGDFVWSDTNGNGIQDAGEPGIADVFIMLTDCDGNWKGQTTSDANGAYSFTNVTPGSYKIKFVTPANHTNAPTDAGSDDTKDSDLLQGWTGFTECFDLASGQNRTDIDAGFVPENPGGGCDNFTDGGTIGGTQTICAGTDAAMLTNIALPTGGTGGIEYMWLAAPGTSCPNDASQAIPGANGPSYDPGVLTETTTFRRCARRVGCTAWPGESNCITVTVDNTPGCGQGNDPASVGDFVWSDTNGNGIQDAGEPGIADVFIMLTDCNGNWKGQTTSDANGAYSFTNVAPGSYKIKFVAPANHTVSPMDAGSDDTKDSDVLPGWTGFTECFDLASGQNRTDIDAGFVPDGQTGGDLTLAGCSDDLSFTAAAGQTTAVVSWTAPTATSTCAGGATLSQTSGPTNGSVMSVGTQTVTYTATDNCGNTQTCSFTVTVTSGSTGNDPASVGDFVWSDTNGNGIQDAGEPGIADVFIMLTDCAGNWKGQTTSDANGAYSFTNITPGSYKIKFVAPANHTVSPMDAGSDDTKDSDVLPGWTGFTECFDLASGQNRTDIDAGFVPDGQTGGDLTLTCSNDITVTAPFGQTTAVVSWTEPTATSTCAGGATLNQTSGPMNNQPMAIGTQTVSYSASDNCGNYETCSFTVTVEQGQPTTPGSIGDFVWNDLNGNGLQDAGEPGLADVFVMLTDCDGNWKGQTTTDANGAYHFANVAPGSYKVKFVGPVGSNPSPTNAGNGDNDSDLNQGWTGFTDCFDVASGQDITNIDAGFTGITATAVLTLNPHADINVTSPDPSGTIVTWTAPTATSTCTTGNVTVTQTAGPASGDNLAPGTYTVTYQATDGCGNTETTSFTITVTYSGPAVCTTRTITDLTQCNGSTQSTFWAEDLIYGMSNISKNYHLVNDGTFTEYEDGTAHFTATVVNNTNSNAKFALDFTLTGKMATGNAHDAYCFNADMSDWYFYSSMTGTITGMGALDGAVINATHHMYSPQIGTGANLHQNVFGFTSWVALTVVSQPNNSNITLDDYGTAHADLNFNLSGDASTCAPAVTTCATRDVHDAYQCDVDLDFGFWAYDFIDQFGHSATETHFEEKGNSTFVEYSNGTAHLSMKVRSHEDSGVKFQIELDFSGRTFTTPSDANDNEYGCYNPDNSDWYYYTNVTGTITGLADMAGAEINVWNTMHPFQMGTGAALWGDWNDFGGTTWLGYTVVSQPDDYYSLSDGGQMDVNIHMSGNATACGGSDYTAASNKVMNLALEQDEFTADLTWQNNTGDINEYFVVERSTDGTNFTPIAQVASDLTDANVTASYTYKDAEPVEGKNYYQVIAVTKDNKKFVSNKTEAIFGNRSDITLFPNPAGEYFMIDLLPYKGAEATITIANQLGQVVKTINLDEVDAAPLRVNLEQFINGYYNVQVQTVDGRATTKKLVVSRMY